MVSGLRSERSHVPDEVIAVPVIPHTRTGKKLEVPVKRLIQDWPMSQVVGVDTVDNRMLRVLYPLRWPCPGSRSRSLIS